VVCQNLVSGINVSGVFDMVFRRLVSFALCAIFAFSVSVLPADEAAKKAETVEVKLKNLVLNLPKEWAAAAEKPMRLATYEIPNVKGDTEKGELAISTFGGNGGGVDANLERWVGQFDAEGREVIIKKGMAGENAYHVVDISGTYQKSVGPPILRKTTAAKGYRMLGMIVQVKGEEFYFLKLTGPDASVKAQADALRSAIGAKSEGEEDYEL
jgi:gluconolactonase